MTYIDKTVAPRCNTASSLPVFSPSEECALRKLYTFIFTLSISGQESLKSNMSYTTRFHFTCYAESPKETVLLKIQHKIQLTLGITLKPCSYSM